MNGRLRPTVVDARSTEDRADDLVSGSLLAAPQHVDIVVPRTTVAGKLRLATRSEKFQANADARRALQVAGIPVDSTAIAALGAHDQWQLELGVRILAVAVRDPLDTQRALGSVDDWRDCDDDQLEAMFARYQDLEAELDPLGDDGPGLNPEELAALTAAAKKGDVVVLMSYGSRKLALWARSSAAQSATSVTPLS